MAGEKLEISPGYTPASVLVEETSDAMDNIFDVLIEWPEALQSSVSGLEAAVSYRCSGFEPPEPKTDTYEVTWHGVTAKKVKSGINLQREITLQFRLDANYRLYNLFTYWKKITGDGNTSGVSNTAKLLGTLKVVAPMSEYTAYNFKTAGEGKSADLLLNNSMDANLAYWTLKDCQVVEVGQPKFKNGASGEKQEYSVKFIFGDIGYPFYADPKSFIVSTN